MLSSKSITKLSNENNTICSTNTKLIGLGLDEHLSCASSGFELKDVTVFCVMWKLVCIVGVFLLLLACVLQMEGWLRNENLMTLNMCSSTGVRRWPNKVFIWVLCLFVFKLINHVVQTFYISFFVPLF